jgi:VWFA-related protein
MSHRWISRFCYAMLILGLYFGGVAIPLFAQAESAGGSAQSGSSFKLRVDVDLVTVEVSVLDKNRKAAGNLKREDFRLYEDGRKQDILSFDEVRGSAAISPKEMSLLGENGRSRGKSVLIVFMENAIAARNLKLARDSVAKFVQSHMQPQDLFAVMSFSASMKILQNLTGERDEVLAAVDKLGSTAVVSFSFEDLLRSIEQISYSIARLKGQKSILIFGPSDLGYTPLERSRYTNAVNAAKRSNVVIYTADPERTIGESGYAGSGRAFPTRWDTGSVRPELAGVLLGADAVNTSGGLVALTLRTLASETGGFSIDNVMDIDSELDMLDQQISNYYVLGFQSNNPKHDGTFRKVEVKTDLKGVTLKYRDGYIDRNPIDVLASSRQEKALLTALASPGSAAHAAILFRPVYFYDSPRSVRVLVAARIRMEKVAFRKRAGQMGAELNIMGVAYAEDGAIAARFSETLPVSFNKEREEEFRKGSLAYRNYFKLRPGKYRLKLALSDESNNLGTVEQVLQVPPLPNGTFAGSSIVLAEQTTRLPDMIQNLQSQMLDQSDPLVYSGMQIEPGVENRLRVNSAVRVLFRLYNLPGRSDAWDLVAKARLLDEKGGAAALAPISLRNAVAPAGTGEAVVGLSLPFQGVPAGRYRLIIDLSDAASSQTAVLQTDLEYTN